jgi:hypothetical protein
MNKTDIFNQLKQAEYKLDIEATQALIWAEQSYYVDGNKDWTDRAERNGNVQGIEGTIARYIKVKTK